VKYIKKIGPSGKKFIYSRGKCLSSAAEQFFSGKNLAVYFVNPQIFSMPPAPLRSNRQPFSAPHQPFFQIIAFLYIPTSQRNTQES
jgi:hypothetical protein